MYKYISACIFILISILFSQCLNVKADKLGDLTVDHLDISFDDLSSNKHYKEEEDPKLFKSIKTSKRARCWFLFIFNCIFKF